MPWLRNEEEEWEADKNALQNAFHNYVVCALQLCRVSVETEVLLEQTQSIYGWNCN